jgi:hypothetical protein
MPTHAATRGEREKKKKKKREHESEERERSFFKIKLVKFYKSNASYEKSNNK